MSTLNERIKEVRNAVGLTQQKFAEQIGVAQSTVGMAETTDRNVSNIVIVSICKTFNVNEAWLKTGEGEMFIEECRDTEIANFFGTIYKDDGSEDTEFKRRFVSMLARLSLDEWKLLAKMAQLMADDKQEKKD